MFGGLSTTNKLFGDTPQMANTSQRGRDDSHTGLKTITNSRQAAKILDVRDRSALHLQWADGRDVWIAGTDGGLYAYGVAAGGGTYLCRHVEIGTVSAMALGTTPDGGADQIDVDQDPPDEVLRRRDL